MKSTIYPFCILIMLILSSCKKTDTRYDFRDAMVGNYYCVNHHTFEWLNPDTTGKWPSGDSIVVPLLVSISKLNSDTISILVNSDTFSFIWPHTANYIKYSTHGKQFSFYTGADSIIYFYSITNSNNISYYNYCLGHKIQ